MITKLLGKFQKLYSSTLNGNGGLLREFHWQMHNFTWGKIYRHEFIRLRRYQLCEPLLKSVRITFHVTGKTVQDLPLNQKKTLGLKVLLIRTTPNDEDKIHESHHLMYRKLACPTSNAQQTTLILKEDLGKNSKLVFCLEDEEKSCEVKNSIEYPIKESSVSVGKVDFGNGLQFTVQIIKKKTTTDIETRDSSRLCVEEETYVRSREQKVFTKMKKNFKNHNISKLEHVPNIAIIGSGGGMRAVIGMSGAITALQNLNILDYAMYTAGLSGSAWYLLTLYAADDKFDPERVNAHIQRNLAKNYTTYIRMAKKVLKTFVILTLMNRVPMFTCTHIFGEMIGRLLLGEKCTQKWSDQAKKFKDGCIPLPLISALHIRLEKTREEYNEWIDISPFEVLLPSYGAAIKMTSFGDKFEGGFCLNINEEPPIHVLQGMCGSAYAIARDKRPNEKKLKLPKKQLASMYMRDRILLWYNTFDIGVVARVPNFLYHLSMFRYPEFNPLVLVKHEILDTKPEDGGSRVVWDTCVRKFKVLVWKMYQISGVVLEPLIAIFGFKASTRYSVKNVENDIDMLIVDAGLEFNSPYPTVLHPARKVDIILSFDFSDRKDDRKLPFEELKKAEKWAIRRRIPFPNLYPNINQMECQWKKGNRKELYIFRGRNSPTIMHFVMINESFRRKDADNNFDVHPTYDTKRFSYSTVEFNKFNSLIQYNVKKNVNSINKCIKEEIAKKKDNVAKRDL